MKSITQKLFLVLTFLFFIDKAYSDPLSPKENGMQVNASIGDVEFATLSRTMLSAKIKVGRGPDAVSLAGNNEVYLGFVELSVYSNFNPQSGASRDLQIYEYEYDNINELYSLLDKSNGTGRIAIDIKSTQTVSGIATAPTSIGKQNGATIRNSLNTKGALDDVIQISFWGMSHPSNSQRAGIYTATFAIYFTN